MKYKTKPIQTYTCNKMNGDREVYVSHSRDGKNRED